MNKFFLVALLVFTGCGTSTSPQTSSFSSYTSEYTSEPIRDCSLLFPSNPYDYGTGHYAGFEWGEENDVDSCGGNSQSFIEGCEDYVEQMEEYRACLEN